MEVWRKNIHNLTDDLMKQTKILDDLDDNGGTGMSSEGGSEMKANYFDHMVNQISKEIHGLMGICETVLDLTRQY